MILPLLALLSGCVMMRGECMIEHAGSCQPGASQIRGLMSGECSNFKRLQCKKGWMVFING